MALAVPATADDVTDSWLEQLLRRHHGDGYSLASVERAPLPGNQALCSEVLCLTCIGRLNSQPRTDHLLCKTLPRDPRMRAMLASLSMTQCEVPVYTDLLPRLSAFERGHGRDLIAAMTAPCLLAASAGAGDDLRQVIVLENLQPAGFATPERVQLPEDALPEAVRQLARLAATSNVWLRRSGVRGLPYLLSTRLPADHPAGGFIRTAVLKMEAGLRRRGRPDLLRKLRQLQEVATQLISRELQPRREELRVIAHGDFRDGNMLLRRRAGGGWEVRVVDWQVSMLCHPAVDLVYLLMLSVPRAVMRRAEAAALRTYWAEFSACAAALGADCPLTLAALEADFRRAKLLGLMWCMSCVSFWDLLPGWPEHCIDIAVEVDELKLLDDLGTV